MRKIAARISFLCLSSSVLTLNGCVVPPAPYEEYTLARTALQAAQSADAARFAMPTYRRAEDSYRNGEQAFKDSDFEAAKMYFKNTIMFAERAENATKIKKFQSGDGFP